MKTLHFLPTWSLQNLEIVNFSFHGNTVICISSTWLYYQSLDWHIIIENDVHKVRYDPAALRSNKVHFMESISSVQFSCSVMSNILQPVDFSTPGFPVHHQLPELAQTHVHRVGDAIQPFHPPSSPSPPTFNLSQHQGLFQWVSSSHQVAKVLEQQLQHQSFQRIFRTDFIQDGLVGSPCSPRDSQESSPTPQFKSINSSALSFLYGPTLTSIHDYWKKHSFD